ncbi:MAG: O-antigen ligase family protein [Dehalobacterium sp.]|jgi:O-antigen ligase
MNHFETNQKTNIILLALMIISGLMSIFQATHAHEVVSYSFLALTPLAIYYFWGKSPNRQLSFKGHLPLWGFLFFSALSLIWSINLSESLGELYKIIFYVLLYYLGASYLSHRDVRKLVSFLVLIGALIALIGILLFLFVKAGRMASIFNNPNPFGIYLAMLSLVSLGIYLMDSKNKWWALSFIILTVAMILTGSRGSIMSFSISLLILLFFLPRKNILAYISKGLFLFSIIGVTVFLISIAAPWIQEMGWHLSGLNKLVVRDSSLSSTSIIGRLSFWHVAWNMIMDRPFTGFGAGTYHLAYNSYRLDDQYWSLFCHNNYLQIWAESGAGALLTFIIFFLWFYFSAYKFLRTNQGSGIYLGILAGGLAFLMHTFVDFSWNMPTVTVLFWILLSCAQVLQSQEDQVQDQRMKRRPIIYALTIGLLITALGVAQMLAAFHIARSGQIAENLGRQDEALNKYTLSTKIFPLRQEYFAMTAQLYDTQYQKTKDPTFAEKSLTYRSRAIQLSPFEHDNYRLMGGLLLRLGSEEAEFYFKKAVDLAGFTPTPYSDLGYYYILKEQWTEGENVLLKGVEQSKWAYRNAPGAEKKEYVQEQTIRMRFGLAAIYHERKDYSGEKQQLEEILLLNPEQTQAKAKLGNL